ncbi:MAG TPA: hypothetical protein VGH34_01370 [Vicinamibacterales bacterium]
MRNYIAVVFDDTNKAYKGLHALWQMDEEGAITVHGTTVVHRNDWGDYQVDSKDTHPALATAVGVGVGALIGALAGPAGAAIGAARGAAIGAASGGAVGAVADLSRADTRDETRYETGWVLGIGESAVIADVSEDTTLAIDDRMRILSGTVHRRNYGDVVDDKWFGDSPYDYYLYPYEYVPAYSPWWAD